MSSFKEVERCINQYYPIYDYNGSPIQEKLNLIKRAVDSKVQASIDRSDKKWYDFIDDLTKTFPTFIIGDMGGYSFPNNYLYIDIGCSKNYDVLSTHIEIILIRSLLFNGFTVFFKEDNFLESFYKEKQVQPLPHLSVFYKNARPNKELDKLMDNILRIYQSHYKSDVFYGHLSLHNTAYKMGASYLKNEWFFERREGCTAFEYLFANDLRKPIIWLE